MGDDYEPYQWQVGDPEDWGDSVGVPDIPYMGYINNGDDDERSPNHPRGPKVNNLKDEAWDLRNQGRLEEALAMINRAFDYGNKSGCYNVKAIILEDMGRYCEALENYNKSLELKNSVNVKDNKARLLKRLAEEERFQLRYVDALEYINEALKITNDEEDRREFFIFKGKILASLGRKRDSQVCYLLAEKQFDAVEEIEKQEKILDNPNETFISIAGTKFYRGLKPFYNGIVVDLIKEPENEHDNDAIRVEIRGETLGYVANSPSTLVDEVKSATQIKNLIKPNQQAEFMFVYLDVYCIARLI